MGRVNNGLRDVNSQDAASACLKTVRLSLVSSS